MGLFPFFEVGHPALDLFPLLLLGTPNGIGEKATFRFAVRVGLGVDGDRNGQDGLVLVVQNGGVAQHGKGVYHDVHADVRQHIRVLVAAVTGVRVLVVAGHVVQLRQIGGVWHGVALDRFAALKFEVFCGLRVRLELIRRILLLLHAERDGGVADEGAEVAVEVEPARAAGLNLAAGKIDVRQRDVVPRQAVFNEDGVGIAEGIDQVALEGRVPDVGVAGFRAALMLHGAAVAAQRHVHELHRAGRRAVHGVVVGGAGFSIRAQAGEDVAEALLLLGQEGVIRRVRHAGGDGGQHLRLRVTPVVWGPQAAGRHGVVDFEVVFAPLPVAQVHRLEVHLVIARVILQHHHELVLRAGAEVEVTRFGVVGPGDLPVAVAVKIQLDPVGGGVHGTVKVHIVVIVVEEGQRGKGQVLRGQPDPIVSVVQLAVEQNAVIRAAVEVDVLRVLQRAQRNNRAVGGG